MTAMSTAGKVVTVCGVQLIKRYGRTVSPRNPGGPSRRECWGARTADGIWDFEREDSPGTPWLVYHVPSVADGTYTGPVDQCGSLTQCARLVASGWAEKRLAEAKAEPGPGGGR